MLAIILIKNIFRIYKASFPTKLTNYKLTIYNMFGLGSAMTMPLILSISTACIFEIINGFNDTSNSIVVQ